VDSGSSSYAFISACDVDKVASESEYDPRP